MIKKMVMRLRNNRGYILLTSYLLVSMMSIFALAIFAREGAFVQAAERNKNKIVAFNMAEAGMDLAIAQLTTQNNYAGTSGFISMNTGNLQGGYSVTVCPPTCTGIAQPTDAQVRYIQATGQAPANVTTDKAYETRSIVSYVKYQTSNLFDFGVFAKDSMQINGNPLIDSYNSNVAAYSAATAGTHGDIGTDSVGASTVTLNGNVQVKGNAMVGPNANPNSVISMSGNCMTTNPPPQNCMIYGTTTASSSAKNYQAATTGINSSGNLNISGNTNYMLSAGTYRFDSVKITGNGKLTLLGATTIYVGGTVQIGGNGVATQSNKPPNFLVYVTNNSSVSFNGNGSFYGAVYAPLSAVSNVGNGSIHGAVVSKTYHQTGNAAVHFDEALKTLNSNTPPTLNLLSWREKNATATQ